MVRRSAGAAIVAALAAAVVACAGPGPVQPTVTVTSTVAPAPSPPAGHVPPNSQPPPALPPSSSAGTSPQPRGPAESASSSGTVTAATVSTTPPGAVSSAPPRPAGEFTLALAGDIHFSERTAKLLAADPATALQQAAAELRGADVTMVNLETAITTRGRPAPKEFHFRAPPAALQALAAGGVDVATMANNHAVDYGDQGLADTLAAVKTSPIPVIGIGADAAQAYAPYTTTVNGVRLAILAASQVRDWTLSTHTATARSPGIASAYSDRLVAAVRTAAKKADAVVVYLHWGIEYDTCPSPAQRSLADALARAGASAVVGTHAHVLQGAGWRTDGTYVAYGLGNYLWWRSFGNEQDDNGVLTLAFRAGRVAAADFLPTHLDKRGVPLVATGAQRERVLAEWDRDRRCAGLSATPPG